MFRFDKIYFALTVLLFITEVVIGVYVRDSIIRPYGGDFLVVILLYCLAKSFIRVSVKMAAIVVLLFAYVVEISQYFKLVVFLGLKHSIWANILLGNSFSWTDMLMYTLGIMIVLVFEKLTHKMQNRKAMQIVKSEII